MKCSLTVISDVAVQGVLIPNYVLYKDAKDGAAYSVPQGTEVEIYRKVGATCLWRLRFQCVRIHTRLSAALIIEASHRRAAIEVTWVCAGN